MKPLCASDISTEWQLHPQSRANDTDPSTEDLAHPDMASSEINFKIQDEGRLAELGYTQELRREWSLLHNFGASFSIIVSQHHAMKYSEAPLLMVAHLLECGDRCHDVRKQYITNPAIPTDRFQVSLHMVLIQVGLE